jgi:hypothetical protein
MLPFIDYIATKKIIASALNTLMGGISKVFEALSTDPEDTPDNLGLADIDHFAQFIRGTKVPQRDPVLAATPDARPARGCSRRSAARHAHVSSIVTAPAGTVINGGAFTVPDALGNKIIHPFGYLLLHGTGDGIVQAPAADTANKLRSVPLWGLRTHQRPMRDLKSLTLEKTPSSVTTAKCCHQWENNSSRSSILCSAGRVGEPCGCSFPRIHAPAALAGTIARTRGAALLRP